MIGDTYYSTGISACHVYAGDWRFSLEFFDLGHAESRSTSGRLQYTYQVRIGEMRLAVETLLMDAKKLGIKFEVAPGLKPRLYIGSASASDCPKPDDWREIFQPLANAINFELMEAS